MILDKLTSKLAQRSARNEESFVDSHSRARRLMLREFLLFVLMLVAMFWYSSNGQLDGALDLGAALLVGAFAGMGALAGTRRAISYRTGWLKGRARMVDALREAMQRGLTMEDWLHGELARDFATMGVVPDERDDDDETP